MLMRHRGGGVGHVQTWAWNAGLLKEQHYVSASAESSKTECQSTTYVVYHKVMFNRKVDLDVVQP